jgi:GTP cyclohydrolase II
VLTKGRIDPDKPTLVRMHRVDMAADMLGHVEARRDYVPRALQAIAEYEGAGVAVFIRDSDPAWLSQRYGQPEASQTANVLRDYGVGAQILLDLGVRDMLLLTSSQTVLPGPAGGCLERHAADVPDRAARLRRLRPEDRRPRAALGNRPPGRAFPRDDRASHRLLRLDL